MSFPGRALERTQSHWFRCGVLAILGIIVRFPALSGQLVWDDASLVRDNPLIKSPLLFGEAFRHYLALDGSSAHYRPIQNISYFFDYLVWNADPFGYHLSNLLWHIGSAVLLYFLIGELLRSYRDRFRAASISGIAFLAAAVWLVHPVHSAAVDYISGRADSLSFFFASAAWLAYLKARNFEGRAARSAFGAASLVLALISLCSRETGCVWMLIFLFHLCAFDRKLTRRGKVTVAGICLCVLALYAGLRQLPSERLLSSAAEPLPLPERAGLILRALGDYGRLIIFPANLHVERSVRALSGSSNFILPVAGLLTAGVLLAGAFWRGKGQPIRALGAGWFILAFLPVSNLFPLNATVAEHWLYLPSVGLLIFLAGLALEVPAERRSLVTSAAAIAVIALSARSFVRSRDWLNPETFYRNSLAAGASKTRFVLNLAQTYAAQKQYAKAEGLLRTLVATKPDYLMGRNALAHLLLEQGKTAEAEQLFAGASRVEASADQPRNWIAALNLAYMKYTANDAQAALAILEKARGDFPGTWRLINLESEILRANGENDKALALVGEFRAANWWHCEAAIEMGRVYCAMHRYPEAEAALRKASQLDVHNAEAFNLIAALNLEQGRLDAACAAQERAVRRQPDQPQQYVLLADLFTKMGRPEDARVALANLARIQAVAKASITAN